MLIETQSLLWLLLPVAAASGWLAARHSVAEESARNKPKIGADYVKGLNFLLDEQPDRAIEVFINMLDVNNDTVETHLALGSLFRKRGEVDRAIRVHQNLIARQTLSIQQRDYALLELAQDYMRAGLLDRAESLFRELVEKNVHVVQSLQDLLKIYQQEKDWERAAESAVRLSAYVDTPMNEVIAQFYCELAAEIIQERDHKKAHKMLKRALDYDSNCVRASIMQGNLARDQGDLKLATKAYRRVEQQDVEFLPEVLAPMRSCYEKLGNPEKLIAFLKEVVAHYKGASVTLVLADLILEFEGEQEAAHFVEDQLKEHPSVRGLERLVELNLSRGEIRTQSNLMIIRNLIRPLLQQLLTNIPVYKCSNCGFSGKVLHWHCPSCKNWNTVKPIHGVGGE